MEKKWKLVDDSDLAEIFLYIRRNLSFTKTKKDFEKYYLFSLEKILKYWKKKWKLVDDSDFAEIFLYIRRNLPFTKTIKIFEKCYLFSPEKILKYWNVHNNSCVYI